jgi:predicted HicB family RNase H-like nuclease
MDHILEYKGYQGSVSYYASNEILVGRIELILDTITFEVNNIKQLKQEFETAVDCYLEFRQIESARPKI